MRVINEYENSLVVRVSTLLNALKCTLQTQYKGATPGSAI